ncbi:alpha/beta hydrolase [Aspergillus vadensis CBS 113365]|uniref:Dienelactone hydrolase domain-containing protein n=1 Tax=Aspergillus vadensis (strain CBS 113365 / IMI 142717 / IBT 24658) TaxID=1448311 RepID=A0A319BD61_ASPVC|nr:dienelactone hydrolase domain-containing protein [Aspergillus vadensis CBS 113365]PYH68660.1 dienelactone hydrolase domain-containing protein [Aspergillus vadensis CBS 113365]
MSTVTPTPTPITFPSATHTLSAHLYHHPPTTPSTLTPAIILSHPMTGVKEQTTTLYATHLHAAGFTTLTFDAAYQGSSTGHPRGLEDPFQRVEDIKSAVTYLSTSVPGVDTSRIGVLGICASGGYACFAAAGDLRIRAVATVSAACVGGMCRCGGVGKDLEENGEVIAMALEGARGDRNRVHGEGDGEAPKMFDAEKVLQEGGENVDSFFKAAAEYYGTSRGKHERSTQRVPLQSYDRMVVYDSFAFMRLIAPRPVLMIAGEEAETLHYSEEAVRLAREPKELFVVPGMGHFDLYDRLEVSGPKLVRFFREALA